MIAKEKKSAWVMGLAAPLALAVGMGLSFQASAGKDKGYTFASDGVLKNRFGECVKTKGPTDPMESCGDMMAQPEADSDGDGVPDSRDKCPGTPQGVKVDADGCPLDSDGDGVPDYKDKCPGTPRGAKVDANGCEIIADLTIDLVNDEFDFDSAKLKPSMKAALDDVAARVKASKGDESLMVIGHTDSIGSEAYNQGLSERRAQATADYLIGQGIAADRIGTKGMGESQPVADNGNKAGRSKNRRVEILTK
jgi:OOP family OmpA-OmpF porin